MGSSSSAPIQADRSPRRDVGNMTEALISSVIQKLESYGNEKALQETSNKLRMILYFLRNKKLGEERKLHYLIDDLIEMLMTLKECESKIILLFKIDSIKSWLGEVRQRMLGFGVDRVEMGSESIETEGTDDDSMVVAIGLEDDVELLLRAAIFNEPQRDQKNRHWSCLITGVAGIGKTTLARKVYNDTKVIDQFDRRAWVRVSGLTNKEILMKLIQQVVDSEELERGSLLEKIELADNGSLRQMLHRRLQGMRYLIVFDDVAKEMNMESILKGLPHEDIGSRLLFTSRAIHGRVIPNYWHAMETLDSDKSWQLFSETIFSGNKPNFSKQLVKNGRDILLTQCGGVPLAIKDLARQLAEKRRSGSEWEQLLQPTDSAAILEAFILQMIQKLDSFQEPKLKWVTDDLRMILKGVTDDLRMILLDFVRDKKLGEGSRLYCLICDLIDMSRDLVKKSYISEIHVQRVRNWTREIKRCVDSTVGSESIEIQGADDDSTVVAIGLEDDVELLLRMAIFNEAGQDKSHHWSCLITGVVGIGKTTLARQVYNDTNVIDQFDRRAWVRVSTGLTNKEILMKLLQQVVDSEELEKGSLLEKIELADNGSLRQMLHQRLQGMRYLIVFDDVPRETNMQSILEGLPREDIGSRLLFTSRAKHVGKSTPYYLHEMEPLDFDKSWQLFSETIFSGNKPNFSKQLVKNGRDILLTQCGGVPLAIKDLARQLAEKRRSGSEWEQLLQPTDSAAIFEAIVLQIVQKLDSLQVPKLKGVTDDLRMMMDFVRDKKLGERSRLYCWICDLVDLVDMARDLVKKRHISEIDIKPVRNWTKEIKRCILEFYGVETESPIEPKKSGEGDEDVLGLEEDVEMLVRRATITREQDNTRLSTCLVTGMVGIGKTTLARQVYNHARVKGQFDLHVWVSVSSITHNEVLMKIIQDVVHCEEFKRDSLVEKLEYSDIFFPREILREHLHKHLQGKRYFIVLDDFPKRMSLKYILEALPYKDTGSRLMLTSRSGNLDKACIEYIHWTKPLNPLKSWQLLLKMIPSELRFPKNLEYKVKEVLRKCDGLPLAIKEVGRQFATRRPSGDEWEEVLESIDFGAILELFEPIYDQLDEEAKLCFMHLAFFKEHTAIRIEKLQQILDTAGIVSGYEIDSCMSILTKECLVEFKDKKSCHVNALLHMLSTKKAGEVIGLEILRKSGNSRPSQGARHRVIKCSRDKLISYSTDQDGRLVSLFIHGGGYLDTGLSYWKRFKLLKILDFEDFGLKSLPEIIGTLLTRLTFMGLRNNHIQELPDSLGCLEELEVLDIALNFMVEVPDIIWKMGKLRDLFMSDVICRKPLKIDMLRRLRTLTYISVDNWTYELTRLKTEMYSLHKLGIEEVDENTDVSKLFASLATLHNLSWLILRGYRFRSMPCLDEIGIIKNLTTLKLEGLLARLPDAGNFPPNIDYLNLVNSHLDEDPMPVLEKLPKLRRLKLRNAYTGQQMVILHGGFLMLEVLCLEELWNLRNLKVGEGALKRLVKLEIKSCPYMDTLPEEIGSMTQLEKLKMVTTRNVATKIWESPLIAKIRVVDINPSRLSALSA